MRVITDVITSTGEKNVAARDFVLVFRKLFASAAHYLICEFFETNPSHQRDLHSELTRRSEIERASEGYCTRRLSELEKIETVNTDDVAVLRVTSAMRWILATAAKSDRSLAVSTAR